jgi:hypothetical protein
MDPPSHVNATSSAFRSAACAPSFHLAFLSALLQSASTLVLQSAYYNQTSSSQASTSPVTFVADPTRKLIVSGAWLSCFYRQARLFLVASSPHLAAATSVWPQKFPWLDFTCIGIYVDIHVAIALLTPWLMSWKQC